MYLSNITLLFHESVNNQFLKFLLVLKSHREVYVINKENNILTLSF